MQTEITGQVALQPQAADLPRPGSSQHLIELPGSHWAIWRCAAVRGAGFPAQTVLRLTASEDLREAVTEVLRAEEDSEAARIRALEKVSEALDRLRESGDWEDRTRCFPLVNASRKLRAGDVPKPPLEPEISVLVDDLRRAQLKSAEALETYRRTLATFSVENSRTLREIAALPRFREAITWQNRQALRTALDPYLRAPGDGRPSTSKSRRDEELITSYLQRYCAKNDTIGFFGPLGWASFVSSGPALAMQPGPGMLLSRKVYFETWPVEMLARRIARDRDVHPWLVPIRMPFIRVEGSLLHHPVYGATRLSPEQIAVLRVCDGIYTAKSMARRLMADAGSPVKSEVQVYKALTEMAGLGLILWEFNIPFEAHPERALREALERIEDESLRGRYLGLLDELERARDSVAAAAGCPEKLDRALEDLEQTFTRLTGSPSTRGHGRTYAGRTIVYEDCRRDVSVQLGPELLQRLAAPLTVLLTSARWLTWELATIFRRRFKEIHRELAGAAGRSAVDASLFFQRITPLVFAGQGGLAQTVQQEFQEKWGRILRIGAADKPLQFSSEELREEVAREFRAPVAGWKSARYHSPDIMIAASSQEAIAKGDYLLAMGEMHVGGNTLGAGVFLNQHPAPEELIHAVEEDLGRGKAVPLPPRDYPELLARTALGLISPGDFILEFAKDGLTNDRARALQVSSLVVEEKDGELVARTHDRKLAFEIIDLVGALFHGMIGDSFRLMGAMRHAPRISIDRLVIKRESWRFAPAELTFAQQKDSSERFLAVQRWAKSNGLPRLSFFRVSTERKPVYLDLLSPSLVEIFCKMVRRAAEKNTGDSTVDITEMLPTTEQTWLADAEGQRYTSELRIVAFDLLR